MRTSKAPRGRLLLAIYTAAAWALSVALVLLRGPDALLIALMAPIVFAGLFYPRRTYLLMTLVADVAALWALQSLSLSLYASVQILGALTLIVIILVEVARRLSAARTTAEVALRRSEWHRAALARLGQQLSAATTAQEAAQIIARVADELIGWDAFVLDLYSAADDTVYPVLMLDLVAGQRTDVSCIPIDLTPSAMMRRVLREGPLLILDKAPQTDAEMIPFGDVSRMSASLMFVPVHSGASPVGVLSIQSYTPQAYDADDLHLLQALADHCGGALERTRAEAQLRESEARYRAISELTSDYVFASRVLDDGRRVTEWVTDAFTRITGYTVDEMEACGGWTAIVYPDDVPIAEQRARSVLAGHSDVSEFRIIRKDGEVRWLRAYTRPEWDSGNKRIIRGVGAIQDITERKRAVEALLHAQKLESLGVLAGGVAHDFNNLLAAIIGNAGLALFDLPPDSPAYQAVQQIEVAAQRATDLTGQMLAYSGRGRFFVERLDLNELIAEMTNLLNTSIVRYATVDYRLAPTLPPVDVDVSQIRQVVMNLVVNASEALGDTPGRIRIATGELDADRAYLTHTYFAPDLPVGTYVFVEVTDTGCGMDSETLAKIFEPFFTTKFTGRGLGLAAVLGIVRGHRGALKVESMPGRGSTFRVLLPATGDAGAWLDAQRDLHPTEIAQTPTIFT